MAIRNIVQVGDPVLRKKSFEVTDFGEKTKVLLDDMKDINIDWSTNKIGWLAIRYYNEDKILWGVKHNFKNHYIVPDKYKFR